MNKFISLQYQKSFIAAQLFVFLCAARSYFLWQISQAPFIPAPVAFSHPTIALRTVAAPIRTKFSRQFPRAEILCTNGAQFARILQNKTANSAPQ